MTEARGAVKGRTRKYWDSIAPKYRAAVRIGVDDFHYGPLVPGDSVLKLLPSPLCGLRCLELGCGRAQNSIFLAKRGASCVASDISEEQLKGAASLATQEGVSIEFIRSAMEDLSPEDLGLFDLVHSSYAIDFCEDAARALEAVLSLLKPDGTLLLSTGHPLFSGEWIELVNGKEGLFLPDYFNPKPDVRRDKSGRETVRSSFRPLSETANMLIDAGLEIVRVLEPESLPVIGMSPEEISARVPYWSKGWLSLSTELSRIPVVAVFKCRRKPAS